MWMKLKCHCTFSVSNTYRLVIFNRRDCCAERLNPFNIHIGDSDQVSMNPKCGGDHHINVTQPSISVSCQGMEGRYVGIRLPGYSRTLTLCEVQVFSANQTGEITTTPRNETPSTDTTAQTQATSAQMLFSAQSTQQSTYEGSTVSHDITIQTTTQAEGETGKSTGTWYNKPLNLTLVCLGCAAGIIAMGYYGYRRKHQRQQQVDPQD
ncbi:uncharacterized protein LOC118419308 [Branchiostoma floridae]|uniref:Uncharacterized protein LOC118419308 n=1 Tax=Branchiostoma floridae TaxID=7739 RepID=A0A9J7MWM7_BRAFL|nr:uncharacterized protein LOC118419308 [Branchiostoma floridae]